ncbi:formylglycine-generating enzyme family protein [Candidatus Poribacteria bacterium]|nr:formylglycine-generating enzyme family protein [Candidatus Poribacteria bacterium]
MFSHSKPSLIDEYYLAIQNVGSIGVKAEWKNSILSLLFVSVLMILLVACSNSPVEEDNQEAPDLEKLLKDMVLIPAGEFLMGSPEGDGGFDEHPQHIVYLDDFYIDKYEVTNAQFKEFVEATGYVTDAERKGYGEVWNPREWGPLTLLILHGVNWRYPNTWIGKDELNPEEGRKNRPHPEVWENYNFDDKMNYPVTQVSWNDTQAYAAWAGKRLPTEAEWEKTARGTDGRKWPWGNVFDLSIEGVTTHTNIGSDGPLSVGCFPTGVSLYGVYNLAGNVQEWVADWYAPDYYAKSPLNNPKGPEIGEFRVLRGGSWRHFKSYQLLSTNRYYQLPDYRSNFVGFRCALSK